MKIVKEKELTLNEYQERAMSTCLPESKNELYMLMGLAEECGELSGKFAKAIRHGAIRFDGNEFVSNMSADDYVDFLDSIIKEAGDVLWMLAGFAHVSEISLQTIAEENLEKLASRKKRQVLDGAGDNR